MRVDDPETPVAVVDLERLEANIARFQACLDRHVVANCPHIWTRISITADCEVVVRGLSSFIRREASTLPVLVECDTGMGRCGVQSPREAAELARVIARSPGPRAGERMTYPNTGYTDPFVRETKALLALHAIPVERVTGGDTA